MTREDALTVVNQYQAIDRRIARWESFRFLSLITIVPWVLMTFLGAFMAGVFEIGFFFLFGFVVGIILIIVGMEIQSRVLRKLKFKLSLLTGEKCLVKISTEQGSEQAIYLADYQTGEILWSFDQADIPLTMTTQQSMVIRESGEAVIDEEFQNENGDYSKFSVTVAYTLNESKDEPLISRLYPVGSSFWKNLNELFVDRLSEIVTPYFEEYKKQTEFGFQFEWMRRLEAVIREVMSRYDYVRVVEIRYSSELTQRQEVKLFGGSVEL
ncbi:TPA: hypothetical protein DF272_03500 [Candidatus Falkowbacteria bacterium]|nr:hypothetical protein [Candidatus Falkowbacteria bacterium]